jgi:Na+-transporting methylmalonyl-CoA/oxaloacetate decarboxylase gamma subunit
MGRGLSKLKTLGVGNKVGDVVGMIMGSMWAVSAVISQIGMTAIASSENGRPTNPEELKQLQSEWTRARKILHWCESRTKKLLVFGIVLTLVSIIIRIILKIAKLASRFSPPAAADFATTYYKAQDILKRIGTTSAIITASVALINRMCSARLDQLLELQRQLGVDDVLDYGDTDPDPFFNFDATSFLDELKIIQNELDDMNRQRSPQTQSECDLIFSRLDAIDTLDAIVMDITGIASNSFVLAQYSGGESAIVELRDRIVDIRRRITPILSNTGDTSGVVTDVGEFGDEIDSSGVVVVTDAVKITVGGLGDITL